MRLHGISFMAFVAALVIFASRVVGQAPPGFGGSSGGGSTPVARQPSQEREEVWIEVVEKYVIPSDPRLQWLAGERFSLEDPSMFRESAEELAKRAQEIAAAKDARRKKGLQAALDKWKEARRASVERELNADRAVTVVRAWDGIAQRFVVFTLGEGQRSLDRRLMPGVVFRVEWDMARPGDDLQARRWTIQSATEVKQVPSEFARWADVSARRGGDAFGEVSSVGASSTMALRATKAGEVGVGLYQFRLEVPPEEFRSLDTRYPWFCEFRIFELDQDGVRVREVSQSRKSVAAALDRPQSSYSGAHGVISIANPVPWGYEVEITRWFGVRPIPKTPTVPPPTPSAPSAPSVPKRPPGLAPPLPGEGPARPAAPKPPSDSPLPDPEPSPPQP
jgi:hypothetical protein